MTKTYTVASAKAEILASGIDKKTAIAIVRELGGPAAATFKQDAVCAAFAPPQQMTVREWARAFRAAGYIPK